MLLTLYSYSPALSGSFAQSLSATQWRPNFAAQQNDAMGHEQGFVIAERSSSSSN
jgi:hypothetical protein